MKKYETIFDEQRKLFRIKALRSFDGVEKGQFGGFIAKEENLSHEGNCWIYGNAEVFEDAKVYENAKIYDKARVYDSAKVFGEAQIYSESIVSCSARVYGNAIIEGESHIYDNACVYDKAHVFSANICGSAQIFEKAVIHYGPWVGDSVQVKGNAKVVGLADLFGNAVVAKKGDYLVLHKWWTEQCPYITWTKSNNKFFDGYLYTGEELIEKGRSASEMDAYTQIVEYVNKIKEL